jgi:hypothetical protein
MTVGDYAVIYALQGRRRRTIVREVTEIQARREVEAVLGGEVLEVEPYDPQAIVRELLAGGSEQQERGRLAAQISQIGHEVQVMAAGAEPDLLQLKARQYLQDTGALRARRAWEGDLLDGREVVKRLQEFHRELLQAGRGSPGIRPLEDEEERE